MDALTGGHRRPPKARRAMKSAKGYVITPAGEELPLDQFNPRRRDTRVLRQRSRKQRAYRRLGPGEV